MTINNVFKLYASTKQFFADFIVLPWSERIVSMSVWAEFTDDCGVSLRSCKENYKIIEFNGFPTEFLKREVLL